MNDLDKALALSCREYRRQGLEALYAQPFETALLPCLETAAAVCTGDAPQWTGDARADLLGAFLCCGSLLERYEGLGIPRETFESTVEDIGRWAGVHRGCTGQIGLSECAWLSNHLRMRLFQLGRVQFCMDTATSAAAAP